MAAETITPGQRPPCALVPSAADLKVRTPQHRDPPSIEASASTEWSESVTSRCLGDQPLPWTTAESIGRTGGRKGHYQTHRTRWVDLRARRERPCDCRAAEQRDELAAPHSITSSAATRSLSGTVRPSILAVW